MGKLGNVIPMELTLAISIASLILSVLGIIAAALAIRKTSLELRKLQKELKERPEVILKPTLDEIIKVNGDIRKAYQRRLAKEERARQRRADKSGELQAVSEIAAMLIAVFFILLPIRYYTFLYVGSSMEIPPTLLVRLRRCEKVINILRFTCGAAAVIITLSLSLRQNVTSESESDIVTWCLISAGMALMLGSLVVDLSSPKVARPKLREWGINCRGRSVDAFRILENKNRRLSSGVLQFTLWLEGQEVETRDVEVELAPQQTTKVWATFENVDTTLSVRVLGGWISYLPEMPGIRILEE